MSEDNIPILSETKPYIFSKKINFFSPTNLAMIDFIFSESLKIELNLDAVSTSPLIIILDEYDDDPLDIINNK